MRITNVHQLPDVYFRAAVKQRNEYAAGRGNADLSVTQLAKSGYFRETMKLRYNDLEKDVSEMIAALMGTATHSVLEAGAGPFDIVELRLTAKIQTAFGVKTLSGQIDHYDTDTGILSDHKRAKVWSLQKGDHSDYVAQLNVCGWLMRQEGHVINGIQNVFILSDWSAGQADKNPDYPQLPIVTVAHEMWDDKTTLTYIISRMESIFGGEHCTDAQRWNEPAKYAVLKKGGTRPTRVFDSPEEATAFIFEKQDPVYQIEVRPGKDRFCDSYCDLRDVCEIRRGVELVAQDEQPTEDTPTPPPPPVGMPSETLPDSPETDQWKKNAPVEWVDENGAILRGKIAQRVKQGSNAVKVETTAGMFFVVLEKLRKPGETVGETVAENGNSPFEGSLPTRKVICVKCGLGGTTTDKRFEFSDSDTPGRVIARCSVCKATFRIRLDGFATRK